MLQTCMVCLYGYNGEIYVSYKRLLVGYTEIQGNRLSSQTQNLTNTVT